MLGFGQLISPLSVIRITANRVSQNFLKLDTTQNANGILYENITILYDVTGGKR